MPNVDPDGFLEFLQGRAGSALRGVAVYEPGSGKVLYLRSDVAGSSSRERTATLLDVFREEADDHWIDDVTVEAGEPQSIVSTFEDRVFVNLPTGPSEGVVVSMDATAAGQLTEFVRDCREWLE